MAQDPRDSRNTREQTPPVEAAPEGMVAAGAMADTQPCPQCGHLMPNLKGGTGSICAVCGFKDSCCY